MNYKADFLLLVFKIINKMHKNCERMVPNGENTDLDGFDVSILNRLQKEVRMTSEQLAKSVGLSATVANAVSNGCVKSGLFKRKSPTYKFHTTVALESVKTGLHIPL